MSTETTKQVALPNDVGSKVIARVDELCNAGFTMPADYNYVNAIKASMLALQEVRDMNKRPALEVCTANSISNALFEMANKGLDVSKHQAYFVVRGDKLCLHKSYFGTVLQVKRIYPNFTPQARVIYQGDNFVYETDPTSGRRKLVVHEQSLENLDHDFVGAYMYLPCEDGGQDLYIMTKKMILAAWAKSSSKSLATHKEFTDKMVIKTIINSGCNMIINSHPESRDTDEEFDNAPEVQRTATVDADYEEVDIDNTPAAEIPVTPQAEAAQPSIEEIDDDF